MDTNTPVRGATPFDLESYLEPSAPLADIGRVLVLLSRQDTRDAEDFIDATLNRMLQNWLETRGFKYPNSGNLTCLSFGDGMTAPRLARDIPWTEFPVVAGPYWRLCGDLTLWSQGNLPAGTNSLKFYRQDKLELRWLLSVMEPDRGHLPALIVLTPRRNQPVDDCLAEFWQGFALLRAAMGVLAAPDFNQIRFVVLDPQGVLQDTSFAAMQQAAMARRPQERFEWAYRTNFRALAGRAMRAVGVEGSTWNLEHPFALQALYMLRELNTLPLMDLKDAFPAFKLSSRANLTFPLVQAGGLLTWPGSGKHDMLSIKLGDDSNPEALTWNRAIHSLLTCGLVAIARDDMRDEFAVVSGADLRLTKRGAALLDLLPADCHDLDLPLRWRTPEGLMGADADVPAMDRWLTTFFRKLKRAVQDLPA